MALAVGPSAHRGHKAPKGSVLGGPLAQHMGAGGLWGWHSQNTSPVWSWLWSSLETCLWVTELTGWLHPKSSCRGAGQEWPPGGNSLKSLPIAGPDVLVTRKGLQAGFCRALETIRQLSEHPGTKLRLVQQLLKETDCKYRANTSLKLCIQLKVLYPLLNSWGTSAPCSVPFQLEAPCSQSA